MVGGRGERGWRVQRRVQAVRYERDDRQRVAAVKTGTGGARWTLPSTQCNGRGTRRAPRVCVATQAGRVGPTDRAASARGTSHRRLGVAMKKRPPPPQGRPSRWPFHHHPSRPRLLATQPTLRGGAGVPARGHPTERTPAASVRGGVVGSRCGSPKNLAAGGGGEGAVAKGEGGRGRRRCGGWGGGGRGEGRATPLWRGEVGRGAAAAPRRAASPTRPRPASRRASRSGGPPAARRAATQRGRRGEGEGGRVCGSPAGFPREGGGGWRCVPVQAPAWVAVRAGPGAGTAAARARLPPWGRGGGDPPSCGRRHGAGPRRAAGGRAPPPARGGPPPPAPGVAGESPPRPILDAPILASRRRSSAAPAPPLLQ